VALRVVREAPCSVLVARPPAQPYRKVAAGDQAAPAAP